MKNLDGIARHQLDVRNLNWDNLFVNPLMPTASIKWLILPLRNDTKKLKK